MIYSKNKNGFTLIEAVMAIAIAATVLTSVFMVQNASLQSVVLRARRLQQMLFAKKFIHTTRRIIEQSKDQRQFSLERKEDDPETFLSYKLESVGKKSSLKKINNLYREKVTVSNDKQHTGRTYELITFFFVAEQEKEHKKQ